MSEAKSRARSKAMNKGIASEARRGSVRYSTSCRFAPVLRPAVLQNICN